jgi:hypothetical protein
MDWREGYERAAARYAAGEARAADERQLVQLANAAWAAGLCLLMSGDTAGASDWLVRAATRYRESWDAGAPADSWGRPIAVLKSVLLAGDDATDAARWTLDAGAADAESAIGRYAAALALLVLGDDVQARTVASTLRGRDDFPEAVADALVTIAAADRAGYLLAVEDVLESFEQRSEFLEDVRVADTVLVFQILAAQRDCAVDLPESELLPHR